MSRIGKLPIAIPGGVKVEVGKSAVVVEGPKGKLTRELNADVGLEVANNQVVLSRSDESKRSKALHGLFRSLLNNMITGVSSGFETVLLINGVGYRAEVQNDNLLLNLGFSNPIEYPIPDGITMEIGANNRITVRGIDKEQLGQVCAEIRSLRPPEPYKGKGIRYENEHVRRKIGKSGIK
jgi:large subunit ribosomal protein L6